MTALLCSLTGHRRFIEGHRLSRIGMLRILEFSPAFRRRRTLDRYRRSRGSLGAFREEGGARVASYLWTDRCRPDAPPLRTPCTSVVFSALTGRRRGREFLSISSRLAISDFARAIRSSISIRSPRCVDDDRPSLSRCRDGQIIIPAAVLLCPK